MDEEIMYITKEVIEDVEHSEIDFLIRDEFGYDYENDQELVEIEVGNGDVTNEPISIDTLIESLQELKQKGSTHVALNYHTDHIGYEMTGYKIYLSTEEQISSYEEKLKIKREKELKLMALREEYNKIANGQD
jgi:ribonuclease HI